MLMAGMAARDIGVQALNLVRKSGFLQEIECAVDGWRLGCTLTIQSCEQVISFGGLWALKQQLQDFAANTRQPLPFMRRQRFGFGQKGFDIFRCAGRIGVRMGMCMSHRLYFGRLGPNVKG